MRYNNTTIASNTLDPTSRGFDQLATVNAIGAGDTEILGDIGILNYWVPVAAPAPDLQMDAATAPANGTLGGQITVTPDFSNQGAVAAGPFVVAFYFSPDANVTVEDAASPSTCSFIGLASTASSTCNGPIDVPSLVPGVYYVGAIVNHLNDVGETNESNNSLASTPVTIDPAPPIPSSMTVSRPETSPVGRSKKSSRHRIPTCR